MFIKAYQKIVFYYYSLVELMSKSKYKRHDTYEMNAKINSVKYHNYGCAVYIVDLHAVKLNKDVTILLLLE